MKKRYTIGTMKLDMRIFVPLIISMIIVLAIFILSSAQVSPEGKKVIELLKEDLEFCEIKRTEGSRFWLICNGRPFYAEYENGNVSYEMRGWSFLKDDPTLWNELEACDFYDVRNSQLVFYCSRNFNSADLVAKFYDFDPNTFAMSKAKETNLLKLIADDVKGNYPSLSGCRLEDFNTRKPQYYPSVLWLTFLCDDGSYTIVTDLASIPLLPPLLVDSDLSNEERARLSFEKAFDCAISNITTIDSSVVVESLCHNRKIAVSYDFNINNIIQYDIECEEDEAVPCLRDFGGYLIFPPIEEWEDIEFIRNEDDISIYRVGRKIIALRFGYGRTAMWVGTEGIYR